MKTNKKSTNSLPLFTKNIMKRIKVVLHNTIANDEVIRIGYCFDEFFAETERKRLNASM